MALMKRGKFHYIYFRPLGNMVMGIKTFARTKTEARDIERAILTACRSGDYRGLDPASREVCVRLFTNNQKELPAGLLLNHPKEELTLWQASELFLKYPEIQNSKTRARHEVALLNLAEYFGSHCPLRSIDVPDIKRFMFDRLKKGISEGTVNREKGALSRLFQIMIDLGHVSRNPVEKIRNLSEKSGQREVYLSLDHIQQVLHLVPDWFRPIVQTAYYTGMRRGEILRLTRGQVYLNRRMILLSAEDTKEGRPKRIPIHLDLVPIFKELMKANFQDSDHLFLIRDSKGIRPPCEESLKNPWRRAMKKVGLVDPRPRFHDLRHTWKTNARRSGVDFEIRESIMGHAGRHRSVAERYGRISDEELIRAIDKMTFDHGETEILVARRGGNATPQKNVNRALTRLPEKKKGHAAT